MLNLIKQNKNSDEITNFVNKFFGGFPTIFENNLNSSIYQRKSELGAVNVKEDDNKYSLEVFVPSFTKDDINVEIQDNYITISAKVENKKEGEKDGYTRKEFIRQSFVRSFTLPEDADVDKVLGDVKDGVLNLTIQKKEVVDEKIKKINLN